MEAYLPKNPEEWLLAALIFCARIGDVSLGTLRIIWVARGMRSYAVFLGFFEVLIWVVVVGQIVSNLTNVVNYVAYAGGFATGNYVGLWIESRLPLGSQLLRLIVPPDRAQPLLARLKEGGFSATHVNASGGYGPVTIVFTVLERRRSRELIQLIRESEPEAFYTIEDVRFVSRATGLFQGISRRRTNPFHFLSWRKSK